MAVESQRASNRLLTLGALVLAVAAAFGSFAAWLSFVHLCGDYCQGRSWELVWQLVVACGGLVMAFAMACLAVMHRWRQAAVAMAVSVVLYLAWAVLPDAATHGWGEGPVPF